jgi:adenylate cyclase
MSPAIDYLPTGRKCYTALYSFACKSRVCMVYINYSILVVVNITAYTIQVNRRTVMIKKNVPDNKPRFFSRIAVRIPLIILIILLIGVGLTIYYYAHTQNLAIIESREKAIREEGEILFTAIKNNMLAGEAPIAVELFKDFKRANFVGDVTLYRADGSYAFSDNTTVQDVNRLLGMKRFDLKTTFLTGQNNREQDFLQSVAEIQDHYRTDFEGVYKRIIGYKLLINQPKCSRCHGVDHVVRGVVQIVSPVDEVFEMTQENTVISTIIYGGVVGLLTITIIVFIHVVILKRIFKMRQVVTLVGEGDFSTKLELKGGDELNRLGERINSMVDGLRERFRLSKFVSKSTLRYVQGDGQLMLGGEKKEVTVLFSDIRNFTGFSEDRDPAMVMQTLNTIMNLQADIIESFGGDIDKFVGDEIMAVFEGEGMVLRALQAAEAIRKEMRRRKKEEGIILGVGIGINTGEVIAGNMGSLERIDHTVIGDAVNLGSRLCSAAGKNTVIFSEFSFQYVKARVDAIKHPAIKVKGKEKVVQIYTLRRTR